MRDDEYLVQKDRASKNSTGLLTYAIFKIIPIGGCFIFKKLLIDKTAWAIIMLMLLLADFCFVKSISGIQLVGLKWSVDFSKQGLIDYYFKPEPYVPNTTNANLFWDGFFTVIVFWLVLFFVSASKSLNIETIIYLIAFISESINLLNFMKAHSQSRTAAEHAVLTSMKEEDEPVVFPLVEDEENESIPANQAEV